MLKRFGSLLFAACLITGCSRGVVEIASVPEPAAPASPIVEQEPSAAPTPSVPNLQSELLSSKNSTTDSPIGRFDFKNYTYELPRGWQNPDGTSEIELKNGYVPPVETNIGDEMSGEQRMVAKARRRIGLSYVTTKFFDVTGDGQDEAVVILKIETGGSALPQIACVFEWKDDAPELLWEFRTGDRADGGLKNVYSEDGELIVELFGQDRFLLGAIETGKITGDREPLCCPTFFTRTSYKWNGKNFIMDKERLTFSIADPSAPPVDKLGDIVNNIKKARKR
ncbi:MAG: hypothetical protein HS105_01705 [Chloracidobacterium sp.]|nr:hypothetical protein [Chloracidobacterium sp.]